MQESSSIDHGAPVGTFDRFRADVAASFVPLRVLSDHANRFHGRIRAQALDDVHVAEVIASEHEVHRTPELAARTGGGLFKVGLQLSGWGLLVQDDREALLGPGDMAIYDTSRPYSLVFESPVQIAVLMFPHQALNLPVSAVRHLTAVRMSGTDGLGALVSPFIGGLGRRLDTLHGATGSRLTRSALDMLGTMYGEILDVRSTEFDRHAALRRSITDHIEANLADPELGPTSIAAAHFISTRHLHSVFRDQGKSVSTWIRTRRLERCRAELTDPLLVGRSVSEIGRRWGLGDAAHLSHAFKAEFGESPSEVRARALRPSECGPGQAHVLVGRPDPA